MYYAEEVIDGILCYKHTPQGDWIPFTKEKLTEMILKLNEKVNYLQFKLDAK